MIKFSCADTCKCWDSYTFKRTEPEVLNFSNLEYLFHWLKTMMDLPVETDLKLADGHQVLHDNEVLGWLID